MSNIAQSAIHRDIARLWGPKSPLLLLVHGDLDSMTTTSTDANDVEPRTIERVSEVREALLPARLTTTTVRNPRERTCRRTFERDITPRTERFAHERLSEFAWNFKAV